MRLVRPIPNRHVLALCRSQGRVTEQHTFKATHIHAHMIWRGALIMKDIDPAIATEKVPRDLHIPLIEAQLILPRE